MQGRTESMWGALLCNAWWAFSPLCPLVGYSGWLVVQRAMLDGWLHAGPIHVAWLSITCRPQVMTGGKKKGQRVDQPARGG